MTLLLAALSAAAAPLDGEVGGSVRAGPPLSTSRRAGVVHHTVSTPPIGADVGLALGGRVAFRPGLVVEGFFARSEDDPPSEAVIGVRLEPRLAGRLRLGDPDGAVQGALDLGAGVPVQWVARDELALTVSGFVRGTLLTGRGATRPFVALDLRAAWPHRAVLLSNPPIAVTGRPGGPGVALVVGARFGPPADRNPEKEKALTGSR